MQQDSNHLHFDDFDHIQDHCVGNEFGLSTTIGTYENYVKNALKSNCYLSHCSIMHGNSSFLRSMVILVGPPEIMLLLQ